MQNSQENTFATVSTLFKKRLTQVFSCEFWEIFRGTSGRLLVIRDKLLEWTEKIPTLLSLWTTVLLHLITLFTKEDWNYNLCGMILICVVLHSLNLNLLYYFRLNPQAITYKHPRSVHTLFRILTWCGNVKSKNELSHDIYRAPAGYYLSIYRIINWYW